MYKSTIIHTETHAHENEAKTIEDANEKKRVNAKLVDRFIARAQYTYTRDRTLTYKRARAWQAILNFYIITSSWHCFFSHPIYFFVCIYKFELISKAYSSVLFFCAQEQKTAFQYPNEKKEQQKQLNIVIATSKKCTREILAEFYFSLYLFLHVQYRISLILNFNVSSLHFWNVHFVVCSFVVREKVHKFLIVEIQ